MVESGRNWLYTSLIVGVAAAALITYKLLSMESIDDKILQLSQGGFTIGQTDLPNPKKINKTLKKLSKNNLDVEKDLDYLLNEIKDDVAKIKEYNKFDYDPTTDGLINQDYKEAKKIEEVINKANALYLLAKESGNYDKIDVAAEQVNGINLRQLIVQGQMKKGSSLFVFGDTYLVTDIDRTNETISIQYRGGNTSTGQPVVKQATNINYGSEYGITLNSIMSQAR